MKTIVSFSLGMKHFLFAIKITVVSCLLVWSLLYFSANAACDDIVLSNGQIWAGCDAGTFNRDQVKSFKCANVTGLHIILHMILSLEDFFKRPEA